MFWKRRMDENVFKCLQTVEPSLANCMQTFLVLGTFDVDSVAQRPPVLKLLWLCHRESAVHTELLCRAWLLRLSLNLILGLEEAVCSFLPFPHSGCTFRCLMKLLMDSSVSVKAVWLSWICSEWCHGAGGCFVSLDKGLLQRLTSVCSREHSSTPWAADGRL